MGNSVALVDEQNALKHQRDALEEQVAAAARRLDPATANSNAVVEVRALTRTNEQLLLQLSEVARAAQSATNRIREIERQKDAQVRQMRLPKEQTDQREQWFVALRYGRVYPLFLYQPQQVLTRARNTAMLDWEGGDGNSLVKPKADRGIDLKTDAATFRHLMKVLPKERFYVVFLTYGDSFTAFAEAKGIALDLGLSHGLRLFSPDGPILLGTNGERVRSQ